MRNITRPLDKLRETCVSPSVQNSSLIMVNAEEYNKAQDCLLSIKDPLWRQVCQEIIKMMGPASLLKIGGSHLGEVDSNKKSMDIYCCTDEASEFVQQYDFVVLGCLQPYFPAVKKLNVKTIASFT